MSRQISGAGKNTPAGAKATAAERAAGAAHESYGAATNCAEAVLESLPKALGRPDLAVGSSLGSAWAGGIADEGCLCGALAAAVIFAGACAEETGGGKHARDRRAKEAAAKIKDAFEKEFGSSCCRVIRRRLSPEEPESKKHCEKITARAAAIGAEVLAPAHASVSLARSLAEDEGRWLQGVRSVLGWSLLGLLAGFEIGWILLKWTWFDMRFNAGLAIPLLGGAGLATALVRLFGRWAPLRVERKIVLATVLALGALLPLQALLFNSGTNEVMGILLLDGFGLRGAVPLEWALWGLLGLIATGFVTAMLPLKKASK